MCLCCSTGRVKPTDVRYRGPVDPLNDVAAFVTGFVVVGKLTRAVAAGGVNPVV